MKNEIRELVYLIICKENMVEGNDVLANVVYFFSMIESLY